MVALTSRGSLRGERGQLVVMRGEERAAAILGIVQVLDHRPGDGEAVEGRGAAADLVEDDERARAGLVQDRGGLDHLHHEGGAAAREIVGGADAGEERVDHADMRGFRRHEGARLRQDGDQRVLAEEGRLAGHVGAGEEPDVPSGVAAAAASSPSPRARGSAPEEAGPRSQSLPTKLSPSRAQRLLHDRVAPALDAEGEAPIDDRADIVFVAASSARAAATSSIGERLRGGADRLAPRRGPPSQSSSKIASSRPSALLGGAGDLLLQLGRARPW